MKAIYRRQVRDALDQQLPEALPGYRPRTLKLSRVERKGATLFAGSRLYGRAVPEGVLLVHVIPHRRQERLMAEVGWSITGRFPAELSSHGPITKPANEVTEPDWLIDFGELYHRKYGLGHLGWDVWRCSVDATHPEFLRIFIEEDLAPVSEGQARDRANAAASACLKDLRDVAVPYLEEWLRYRRAAGGAAERPDAADGGLL